MYPKTLLTLIDALKILPSVGHKSATRMAFYLLEKNPQGAHHLIHQLKNALEQVVHCRLCRTLTDQPVCSICNDAQRDKTRLCIVEHPADLHALELGAFFDGRYFVLHGYLSPLDGVNPDDLGLSQLKSQIQDWGVTEVILATNPTVEGNATAFYIQEMLKDSVGLRVSRIAHGVPMGGSIEYLDGGTLFHAFNARQTL